MAIFSSVNLTVTDGKVTVVGQLSADLAFSIASFSRIYLMTIDRFSLNELN